MKKQIQMCKTNQIENKQRNKKNHMKMKEL